MRNKLPFLIAMAIGIVIMIGSYTMIQKQVKTATSTINVVVPKSDVEAFSIIKEENLTVESVAASVVDKNTARQISQLANKICTTPLYAGKTIDLREVAEKSQDIGDKQVVGIYIDAARCAGVTEGDIVDVYRIGTATQGEAAPMVAANCRVMRITDDKGVPVKGASALMQNVGSDVGIVKNPRIIYLMVSSGEVPYVIQGSSEKDQQSCLSLAKKGQETTTQPISTDNDQPKGVR